MWIESSPGLSPGRLLSCIVLSLWAVGLAACADDSSGGTGGDECVAGASECSGDGVRTCADSDGDGLTEWSAVTPCGAGQSCSGGVCSGTGCVNECASGSRDCQGAGFVTCGDFDADECLEWSAVTACTDGLVCSFGECSDTCANECGTTGQRQCSGNGTQACGDFDADECLEWSDVTACEEGQSCSQGTCQSGCFNECSDGASQCSASGGVQTCGDFDADACFEWSTATPCDDGETCSQGECSDSCTNECSTIGVVQCGSGGVQTCGNHDADSCLEWSLASSCPEGQTCSQGECSATCNNECADGAVQCSGNGTQTCGNFDDDACFEWSTTTACDDGETCSLGECGTSCADECVTGGARCVAGGVQACGNVDGDDCSDWAAISACPGEQVCSDGECADTCVDECPTDAARCGAGGVQTCGNFDGDECAEWSTAVACDSGEVCSNGACSATCSDECASGSAQCSGGGVQECGDFDDDDCLEWSAATACGADETCSRGICGAFCSDECPADASRCAGAGIQSCGEFDGDSCLEWGAAVPCPGDQTCSLGVCSDSCTNECTDGQDRCATGGVETCGNFDGDDCTEWSVAAACDPGQVCDEGTCVEFSADCETNAECAENFICVTGDCLAAISCGSDEECAPSESCDALNGFCQPDTSVPAVGDNCSIDADCGIDSLCADADASSGYCTFLCDGSVPCPTGSSCFIVSEDPDPLAICLRDCVDDGMCASGHACFGTTSPLGGSCLTLQCSEAADCDNGNPLLTWSCEAGVCVPSEECDTSTGEGCAAGDECVISDGIGVCLEGCDILLQDCSEDEACIALGLAGNAGLCIPSAGAGQDSPCFDGTECAAGLLCIPDALGDASCLGICDITDPSCPGEQICISVGQGDVGVCLDDCEVECEAGTTRCDAGDIVECGNFDADICLEWSAPIDCGEGLSCSELSGLCEESCVSNDDCFNPLVGTSCESGSCVLISECDPATGTGCAGEETCLTVDSEGLVGTCLEICDPIAQDCSDEALSCALFAGGAFCLDTGSGVGGDVCESSVDCAEGFACLDSGGAATCEALCDVSDGSACGDEEVCVDLGIDGQIGLCIDDCVDDCVDGTQQCGDAGGIQLCGDFDADSCLELGAEEACDDGQTCDPSFGVCRFFCDDNSDCPQGEAFQYICVLDTNRCEVASCSLSTPASCSEECVPQDPFEDQGLDPDLGYCLDGCDPVSQDCPTDDGVCEYYPLDLASVEFVCLATDPEFSAGFGEQCFFLGNCEEGLSCIPFDDGEGGVINFCVPLCDIDTGTGCVGEETCEPVGFFPDDVGICL